MLQVPAIEQKNGVAASIPAGPTEITLQAKVAFLSQRQSYPHPTTVVEARETHMSWVFLTDSYAYKLKKPVRTALLDFSTLDARRIDCEKEFQLNLRLAAGVYLGVAAITVDDQGQLSLDGTGECVDWLVKMRRVPAWRNLENLIAAGGACEADIRRFAHRLTEFYALAPPVPMEPENYCLKFQASIRENRGQLVRPIYGLPIALVDSIATSLLVFLARHSTELRARAGRVVEAHGDLRPEHVYLTAQPIVLDCLEFNRDLRLLDPADELAYLAMECERLGAAFIEDWLFEVYGASLGERPHQDIVSFYKACNALLRARIAIQHLDEPQVRDRAKWMDRANQYLRLAQRYCGKLG